MKMLKVTKFQYFMFNHCRKNTLKVCFGVNVDPTVLAGLNFTATFLEQRMTDCTRHIVQKCQRGKCRVVEKRHKKPALHFRC